MASRLKELGPPVEEVFVRRALLVVPVAGAAVGVSVVGGEGTPAVEGTDTLSSLRRFDLSQSSSLSRSEPSRIDETLP